MCIHSAGATRFNPPPSRTPLNKFIVSSNDSERTLVLEGAGGEPFTALVDALLCAHGAVLGLVDADIDTTIRTTIPDGGVDTSIRRAIAGDSTGWLSTAPTAWQYKGTDYKNIKKSKTLDGPRPVPGRCTGRHPGSCARRPSE